MDSIRLTFSTEVSAMYSLFIVAAAAFAAAFVLTPICRNLAIRWGMLDRPDHERKIQPGPTHRTGGGPFAMSALGSVAHRLPFSPKGGVCPASYLRLLRRLSPAAALVFGTGPLDD